MEPLLWFHLNVHHDFTLRYAQMPIVGTSSGPRKKWVQLHLGTRMFFSVGLSNSPTSKNSIYLHELAWVSSLIHHDILKVWTDNFALTTHMNMIEMFLPPTNHCTSYSCRADRLIIFVQVRSCWAISSSVSGLLSLKRARTAFNWCPLSRVSLESVDWVLSCLRAYNCDNF